MHLLLLYTQSALQSCVCVCVCVCVGGGAIWIMRRLPHDNRASALTTPAIGGEERES